MLDTIIVLSCSCSCNSCAITEVTEKVAEAASSGCTKNFPLIAFVICIFVVASIALCASE